MLKTRLVSVINEVVPGVEFVWLSVPIPASARVPVLWMVSELPVALVESVPLLVKVEPFSFSVMA